MLWPAGCLALCLVLSIPTVRGLWAVYLLERRARVHPPSLVLARDFHRPLYAACLVLLGLRAAFFALILGTKSEQRSVQIKMTTLWLLDLASVAMTATLGYFVLFAVRLVFRRRWPGTTTRGSNGMVNAVFLVFCASLLALVTLVAISRAQANSPVPQWMTFGYAAVIWTTLGLLLVKYGGQAVQILWRYRRRNQWSISDEEELKNCCRGLPVLSFSCLKNLAVCSTLLAELSVLRGISCVVVASQSTDQVDVDSWRSVGLHYLIWEAACVVIVLRMLHQTPIAVYSFHDGTEGARRTSTPRRRETPSAPALDEGEIQIQFQVPSVHDLVADYVVPSNASLLSAQRQGMEHEDSVEHRYCQGHHGRDPSVGAEYVSCRCREREDDRFLSNANVPLLTEEYEERSTPAMGKIR